MKRLKFEYRRRPFVRQAIPCKFRAALPDMSFALCSLPDIASGPCKSNAFLPDSDCAGRMRSADQITYHPLNNISLFLRVIRRGPRKSSESGCPQDSKDNSIVDADVTPGPTSEESPSGNVKIRRRAGFTRLMYTKGQFSMPLGKAAKIPNWWTRYAKIGGMNVFVKGCLNVTITPETKELEIFVDAIGKKVIGHKFSFAKAERVCDRLPGKLDAFKGCLYTDTTDLPDKSGIQTCTKIDFMKDTKIVAKIAFACVQFKDGQLSLNDNGDVKAKDLYSIKAGNPFKGFLNMVGWRQPSNKA
ncbi:unnamed protein product [Nesidiocoris tenuis]|uniref:Uncharacterized protein n=1 Tax=Nesidiocoris tenuis TaxID=355587 RepID=A0A6H5FWC2_9HEMI|nr:unnamed protein product [Nesidiocoris tenuis]